MSSTSTTCTCPRPRWSSTCPPAAAVSSSEPGGMSPPSRAGTSYARTTNRPGNDRDSCYEARNPHPRADPPSNRSHMTPEETRNSAIVDLWIETYNHDFARMVEECYAPDCEMEFQSTGFVVRGREQLHALEQAVS